MSMSHSVWKSTIKSSRFANRNNGTNSKRLYWLGMGGDSLNQRNVSISKEVWLTWNDASQTTRVKAAYWRTPFAMIFISNNSQATRLVLILPQLDRKEGEIIMWAECNEEKLNKSLQHTSEDHETMYPLEVLCSSSSGRYFDTRNSYLINLHPQSLLATLLSKQEILDQTVSTVNISAIREGTRK